MTKSPSPSPSSAVLPSPHDDGTLLKYPRTYTTATLPEPQHRHPDARILEEEERRAAMATRTAAKSSGEGRGETIHDMPRGDAGRMSTMAADLRALAELTGLAGMAGLGGEQHTGASAGTVRGSTAANGDARASGDAHTSARANAGTAASRDTSPMTVPRAESFFGGPGAEAMQHYLFQQSPAERTVILAQLMQTYVGQSCGDNHSMLISYSPANRARILSLGIAAQRPPLPAVRAEYKHYYGTSTAPTPLDETEQRLLREAQHAMAGRPLLESQFAVADYLTQRETCRKRWGRVMDAALRRFLDDRQLKGGDVLEVRKGGSGGGKGYGGYPYDREFQSFGMSVRPRVVLERGKSYVDVGFTDLGMLLNATFASECDPKKTLVDGTSSSTAWPTPRHGKLPKQQQPPPPQQQRIHYIGYDASPVVIAKTMVLLEALRSGVDAKLIAELWFSLLWSPLTECVFRTAVDTVIESIVAAEAAVSGTSSGRMPPLDPNATLALATPRVREVLIAWQRATSPTVTEALHLLHGQLTFDMCYEGLMFVMADVRDRVDAARYFLRRSFPVRPMNSRAPTTEGPAHAQQLPQMPVSDHHSCGNVMTLSTPGRFGQCVLHEELIYFALPMSNILQMGRVNGDVANGTREPKRIFDEMFDYVVE